MKRYRLWSAFGSLAWYEWLMLAAMIIIGGYYTVTDDAHPLWYLIVNYISSAAGVCCIFLCAHASRTNWLFAVINTVLYIAVLFYNKVWGTMALELLYYMPTNIIGFTAWRRHRDGKEKDKCLTKVMDPKQRLVMTAFVVLSTTVCHFVLVSVGGATAWLDAMTVSIGIVATYFEIKRYADQYYLWIVTDVIAVVQWVLLRDAVMITKKSIYLIMAVLGLVNWLRLQRERNRENL